jgi:methyl-accepting chemotaxis protein
MNDAWLWIIGISVAVTAGYVISLIIELKKTLRSVNDLVKTTQESLKPTIEEVQETLRSLRGVSDNLTDVTSDIRTLSSSVRDVGVTVKQVSGVVGNIASLASIQSSGLKAGVKASAMYLLHNLFSKKGGDT